MEETTKISLFGQQVTLPLHCFSSLESLCFPANMQQIKLPPWMLCFQAEEPVLNACLYYLLAVQKGLSLSSSLRFREKCLESISEYYIRQKMNFQLYQYAFVSAKILSLPLQRVMHVLYYLLYSRIASKPFIVSMIAKAENKSHRLLNKNNTIKSEKQYSSHTKSHDSRHMTIFYDSSQLETDVLRRQLKKVLSPSGEIKKMTRKMENKRYFNLKKVYPEDQDLKHGFSPLDDQVDFTSLASSRINVPVKVSKNDHSSVILKLKANSFEKDGQTLCKIQMRRQKFNEWFDGMERYEKIMNNPGSKENKTNEWGTSKNILEKDLRGIAGFGGKVQKHPYEYYKEITSSIKAKNQQLDSIRSECFHHKTKHSPSILKESQHSNDRHAAITNKTIKTETSKTEGMKENYTRLHTNRETTKMHEQQEYICSLSEEEKSTKCASQAKLQSRIHDHVSSIITRKNQSIGTEEEMLIAFNKKLKNKFKLQKYKHQYRQFLRTQLFEKVKEAA